MFERSVLLSSVALVGLSAFVGVGVAMDDSLQGQARGDAASATAGTTIYIDGAQMGGDSLGGTEVSLADTVSGFSGITVTGGAQAAAGFLKSLARGAESVAHGAESVAHGAESVAHGGAVTNGGSLTARAFDSVDGRMRSAAGALRGSVGRRATSARGRASIGLRRLAERVDGRGLAHHETVARNVPMEITPAMREAAGVTGAEILGVEPLAQTPWMTFGRYVVRNADGETYHHHALMGRNVATTIPVDGQGRVGAIYRGRMVSGQKGWEFPAGVVDDGEDAKTAAVRETLEEIGYTVKETRSAGHPVSASGGSFSQTLNGFVARDDQRVGDVDPNEAAALKWFTPDEFRQLIDDGEVTEALTVVAFRNAEARGLLKFD